MEVQVLPEMLMYHRVLAMSCVAFVSFYVIFVYSDEIFQLYNVNKQHFLIQIVRDATEWTKSHHSSGMQAGEQTFVMIDKHQITN